jgi:hypothetical protein
MAKDLTEGIHVSQQSMPHVQVKGCLLCAAYFLIHSFHTSHSVHDLDMGT